MNFLQRCFNRIKRFKKATLNSDTQELDPYWDEQFSAALEVWGEGTVWDEIKYLLVGRIM